VRNAEGKESLGVIFFEAADVRFRGWVEGRWYAVDNNIELRGVGPRAWGEARKPFCGVRSYYVCVVFSPQLDCEISAFEAARTASCDFCQDVSVLGVYSINDGLVKDLDYFRRFGFVDWMVRVDAGGLDCDQVFAC
jgi:hypothetical protein